MPSNDTPGLALPYLKNTLVGDFLFSTFFLASFWLRKPFAGRAATVPAGGGGAKPRPERRFLGGKSDAYFRDKNSYHLSCHLKKAMAKPIVIIDQTTKPHISPEISVIVAPSVITLRRESAK